MNRLPVRKTYKLFIGGAFPRSESGRTYDAKGANVARGSRPPSIDSMAGSERCSCCATMATARPAMIPGMRVETILAARNRAGGIVILGCARPGDYG